MSIELILTLVTGFMVSLLSNFAKNKNLSRKQVQFIVLGFAVLGGASYQVYTMFVPDALKVQIVDFTLQSLGFAVLGYEYVWKNFMKNE